MALTDEAIVRIKDMIMNGQLHPGDRLPREPDLAVQLGLSRNSLREAVKALSPDQHPRCPAGRRNLRDQSRPRTPAGCPDLRRRLPSGRLGAALPGRTSHPGARRRGHGCRAHPGGGGRRAAQSPRRRPPTSPIPTELLDLDLRFHRLIATCSRNPVLASLLEGLSAPTNRARIWRGLTETGAHERTAARARGHRGRPRGRQRGRGPVGDAAARLRCRGLAAQGARTSD